MATEITTQDNVNTEKKLSSHPLKNNPFFGVPRHIGMRTDISDALYRLLSILYGSYGHDGHLEFKIETLCRLMGGKAYSSVKRIIAQGRKLEIFETWQTGRSISFRFLEVPKLKIKSELSDDSGIKNEPSDSSKMSYPYHLEKKGLKKASPPPPSSPKTDLPEIIKTELENSEIEIKLVVECQERFRDTEYTLEAIRLAKTKEHHSPYFRFLALKKCDSVLRRIAVARAETELIRKNREILNRARIEQEEASRMSTLTITDFAEGAAMMRAALRKDK